MVNTSDRPITVDGVRLDTLAWNISKINRAVAARRSADQIVPGRDGVIASLNDNLEPITFGLEMFVMGTDADGAVPAAGRRDTFRANLEELVHLFGKRHALLEVQETTSLGVIRRAMAKVQDAIQPDVSTIGSHGSFTVGLQIPAGCWEDVATSDFNTTLNAFPGTGVTIDVTNLQGATGRITDAIILVTGPITNPRVTDPNTGAYVEYQGALTAADKWRVNVGTWATRVGTTLTLGSLDTGGTDAQAATRFGGTPNQAAFLPLVPVRSGTVRKVQVVVTGTGTTTATRLGIRARRKYAV